MLGNGDLHMEPNEVSIELCNWLDENNELDPKGMMGEMYIPEDKMKNKPVIINNTIVTNWIYAGILGPGCWECTPRLTESFDGVYEWGGLYPDGSIFFNKE